MRRRILGILAILSLLLLGFVAVMWARSYGPLVGRTVCPGHELLPIRGQVIYYYSPHQIFYTAFPVTDWRYLGFGYEQDAFRLMLRAPYWFPAALMLIMPAWYLRTLARERRRRSLGRCVTCGYDLRASSDRCPECGTPISAAGHASEARTRG